MRLLRGIRDLGYRVGTIDTNRWKWMMEGQRPHAVALPRCC
ncbi:MAG: hypothetical protein AVDCRST_MAG93-10058 [uncultured Chloroflexia bacterium]|uniref:Uncharacterized protein n=1 Tax=uncultured Chloroflexia bacterium TaxID=1672391 RepID=A0A6J4NU53_9CHLR|nr:MAG: hypothetical protein AVDCRST_MAG93-10058 [uncultured Chloroflexia bacterium]